MNCHRRIAADGRQCRNAFGQMLKRFAVIPLLLLLAGCGHPADTAERPQSPEKSAAVRVAILDSGLSWEEDSLTDIGWNYLEENQSTQDDKGHGTQVAKLIRLYAPNAVLVPLKITDSMSDATGQIVVQAIYDAVDRFDCDVLCLAFSIPPSEELSDAVAYAEQQRTVLVSAAGNLGQTYKKDKLLYPAAYETVIGVGALGQDGAVADYSQRNQSVFVTAPGESIDGTQQGTSFAAARIAGICAGFRWTTPEDCRSSLRIQAQDCGSAGYDTEYGWGVLAAPNAAKAATAPTAAAELPPENTPQDISAKQAAKT